MTCIGPVVPAILTDDPTALKTMLLQAESYAGFVQIDIMDGQFVPSKSITPEHLYGLQIGLDWEAHLMVLEPENYLEAFRNAGAKRVIFHYEATATPQKVISLAQELRLKIGIAVNPETPVSVVLPLIGKIDNVLFLSVNPGFYGAPFIPEVLDKIKELRRLQPDIEIGIDGGVKERNIAQIARSGVDTICVGSAILLQPDPGKAYRHLQQLVRQARQAIAD